MVTITVLKLTLIVVVIVVVLFLRVMVVPKDRSNRAAILSKENEPSVNNFGGNLNSTNSTVVSTTKHAINKSQTDSTVDVDNVTKLPQPHIVMSDSPFIEWQMAELKFKNLYLRYNLSTASPQTHIQCKTATLLVIVLTRASGFEWREAIRNTWANKNSNLSMPPGILVRFGVGRDSDPNNLVKLYGEQKKYDDLILYDYPDEYRLLHVKMHAVFAWQQAFCPSVKFVFRVDADTVVDLTRLQYWIDTEMGPMQKSHPSILFGIVRWADGNIIRDKAHKWYVSKEDFSGEVYPPYVFGPFFVLSSEAVAAILDHTYEVKAFSVDDALYTAVVAEKAGVLRVDGAKHFRLDDKVKNKEGCDSRPGQQPQPYVVAVCCLNDVKSLHETYEQLRLVQCA